VPVQVYCPHCITPCLVAEQHLGVPVQCHKCRQPFTALPAAPTTLPRTDPLPPAAGSCRLDIGSASSCGKVRERNEDSLFVQQLTWINLDQSHEIALIVVADGMGGYEAGDVASRLVIRTMGTVLAPLLTGALNGQFADATAPALADTIDYAMQEANRAVYRKAKSDPACKGMGSTVAAVLVWDGQALIGHAGDCRVYHQRGDRLTQVTHDHTLVARMVELGQLTPEEAAQHPARNQVTQAIGKRPEIQPSRHRLQLARGDWLVIACDGLYAHVDDRTLQEAVSRSAHSATRLAGYLVDLANRRGGSDNCTVVTAYCY
jgi:serine/threonine protein phosphatase PrpC